MSSVVNRSLRYAVPLAAVFLLSACSDDREQPLTRVDTIDIPEADTTTRVNINIDDPTLNIPDTFQVSDGDLLTLVWSDEFNAAQLDPEVWFFETGDGSQYGIPGWGNFELQWYLPDNASLEDGKLKIEVRRETVDEFGFTSARINTRDRFAFKYGRIEASIKLPSGQGLWPAFWMLAQDSPYGNWPSSGEIDILEAVNLDGTPGPGGIGGGNEIFGTLHYGGGNLGRIIDSTEYVPTPDVTEGFHTYALEWDEFEIRWYFDGILWAFKNFWQSDAAPYPAPFDQPFYVLLNVAVGGNFPGSPDGTTPFPSTMEVDWIRLYSGEEPVVEPADPGIVPEVGVYVSDPATMNEDLAPPGGIQNFGSGAAFTDIFDDNSFIRVLQTTSGEGYGAGAHVGFAAFTGYDAGFASGYETLQLKVKGDAANLAAFEVKFFAGPGEPETSQTYDATSFTDLGDGWYQLSIPISDFPTVDTNTGFLLGPLGAQAAPFSFLMTDVGFDTGGGGPDPSIDPDAVVYATDPAVVEDLAAPGGVQNFGSGAVIDEVYAGDPDFNPSMQVTSGEGYGAGVHVGFAAFPDYAAGFAAGYENIVFKVKGDAANLAAFEVKFFAAPGEPETSQTYDATSFPALGNGWYQVSVPISDFPTVDTNTGFLLGPLGAQAAPFSFLMTDIGFTTGGGGGGAGEIAVNGGFETGDFTGWTQFEATPGDQTVNTGAAGDTSSEGTFHLEINNTASDTNSLIKQERVGFGTVVPGIAWTVTFDARGSFEPGGVAFAQVFSETAAGNEDCDGCGILGGAPLALNADPTVWTPFTFSGTAGPNTESLTLQLEAVTGAGNLANVFYDNISIVVGDGGG